MKLRMFLVYPQKTYPFCCSDIMLWGIKCANQLLSCFYNAKLIIIRQISLFFIDLADYIDFLFYFCGNKTYLL